MSDSSLAGDFLGQRISIARVQAGFSTPLAAALASEKLAFRHPGRFVPFSAQWLSALEEDVSGEAFHHSHLPLLRTLEALIGLKLGVEPVDLEFETRAVEGRSSAGFVNVPVLAEPSESPSMSEETLSFAHSQLNGYEPGALCALLIAGTSWGDAEMRLRLELGSKILVDKKTVPAPGDAVVVWSVEHALMAVIGWQAGQPEEVIVLERWNGSQESLSVLPDDLCLLAVVIAHPVSRTKSKRHILFQDQSSSS